MNLLASRSAIAESSDVQKVPESLKLRANRQFLDSRRNVTVAEGDVSVHLGSSLFKPTGLNSISALKPCMREGLYVSVAEPSHFRLHHCDTTWCCRKGNSMTSMA